MSWIKRLFTKSCGDDKRCCGSCGDDKPTETPVDAPETTTEPETEAVVEEVLGDMPTVE